MRHFFGYWEHSLRHLMPMQKQEYYLAQMAYLVAATMGGFKGGIGDFLLGDRREQEKSAKAPQVHKDLFKNFNPVKKKETKE